MIELIQYGITNQESDRVTEHLPQIPTRNTVDRADRRPNIDTTTTTTTTSNDTTSNNTNSNNDNTHTINSVIN